MLDESYGRWGKSADFAIFKAVGHADVSGKWRRARRKPAMAETVMAGYSFRREIGSKRDLVSVKLQRSLF